MASTGIHGHGATLSIAATAVGNIISIAGPDMSRDSIDISTMDSPTKHREFIPGMIDSGEITAELNYDGTTVATLLKNQMTASAQAIVVTIPDGDGTTNKSTYTGTGFVTSLGHAVPFDDKVTQSVGIKLTSTLALT